MTSISICSLPILVQSYLVENDEPFWIISLSMHREQISIFSWSSERSWRSYRTTLKATVILINDVMGNLLNKTTNQKPFFKTFLAAD